MTTREIRIGTTKIGGGAPVMLQSMCATKTTDAAATAATAERLKEAGAGLVRVAVDTENDARALAEIRRRTSANLSVDLQENYRLAEKVAPFVDKIRYNPGHLHHQEPELDWREKVRYLARVADDNDVALRIGINCGSLDPSKRLASGRRTEEGGKEFDSLLASALEHADFLESVGFTRFCVSVKDSDPETVVAANRRFRTLRPEIPLHLGVTEAGLPPVGVLKSRSAFERLLAEGIGETLRVSLTVENRDKAEEIAAGKLILANVAAGIIFDPAKNRLPLLNIVSCPSCARVENDRFVALARGVQQATEFARDYPFKIAVMGCRVNGPGETDDADLGLWCGASKVNLKEGEKLLGSWPYEEIIDILVEILHNKIKTFATKQKPAG